MNELINCSIIHRGKHYEYIRSPHMDSSRKNLLIFHGIATTAELLREELEHFDLCCNVLAPTLNHANNITEWQGLIEHILQKEGISSIYIKGGSFGGIVAQAITPCIHTSVNGLILVNTLPPQKTQVKSDKIVLLLMQMLPFAWFKKNASTKTKAPTKRRNREFIRKSKNGGYYHINGRNSKK